MILRFVPIAAGFALIIGLALWAGSVPSGEREIACYVTGLQGRTPSQVHNVSLSARRISGTVIQPGQVFSFVRSVGPWTADMGYVRAPVSYDGELVRDWGGGVCQTSSTLYNAALLAGLEVVERHHHHWPARYAPLGRDAAVAYSDIDLKFRNTLPEPVRIVARVRGDKLAVTILSRHTPACKVEIESRVRSVTRPGQVVLASSDDAARRLKLVNRGHPGFFVETYRRFTGPHGSRRELLSQDSYPAMNRVVRVARR